MEHTQKLKRLAALLAVPSEDIAFQALRCSGTVTDLETAFEEVDKALLLAFARKEAMEKEYARLLELEEISKAELEEPITISNIWRRGGYDEFFYRGYKSYKDNLTLTTVLKELIPKGDSVTHLPLLELYLQEMVSLSVRASKKRILLWQKFGLQEMEVSELAGSLPGWKKAHIRENKSRAAKEVHQRKKGKTTQNRGGKDGAN